MEENLQLEEIQRTNQQIGDEIPHDPNASAEYPEGYTPVPDVNEQTPVEEVEPSSVGEVEETTNVNTPQTGDLKNEGSLSSSGDFVIASDSGDTETKTLNSISPTLSNDVSLDFVPSSDATVVSNGGDATNSSVQEETVDSAPEDLQDPVNPQDPQDPQEPESPAPVDPEEPEEPPVDPEEPEEPPTEPPVDPEEPPTEPPVDPEEPPTEPPVDPEEPPTEPPVDPEEPPTEPPVDPEEPEEPPVDPEEPEEPPTEPSSGQNPGNDKEVGNSPWDGETGASDNPGKGNHQDGEDPEINQPPGDSKNDGGQNDNSENDNGNGGGGGNDFERGQNNGWGNGDDTPPGNSGSHNNAENDETPNSNTATLVEKFLENHSFNDDYDNRGGRPEYDTYETEDFGDVNIVDIPEPIIEFEVPDYATDSPESFDFS
jgi:hypothetical protein